MHIPIRTYPIEPSWRIEADWQVLPNPLDMQIDTVRGIRTGVLVTHQARFRLAGQEVRLLPTHWKRGNPMVVFRDATAGREPCAAGRFLIGKLRGPRIMLDFNRAFNPPCAFTPRAACPLPPAENVLPFAITAGERSPGTTK